MTPAEFDVCAIGNAIVDIVADVDEEFLAHEKIPKSGMILVDAIRITQLRKSLKAARAVRAGGASGNMVAGIASFGGKAAYMGKIAHDEVGHLFSADLKRLGVAFPTVPMAAGGEATGLCLSLVTAGANRSMCTYIGASADFSANDVHAGTIRNSQITYLEAYMLDRASTRLALMFAVEEAKLARRRVALTLCDPACVERNRKDLLELLHNRVDILFANEKELMALHESSILDAAIYEVKAQVAIGVFTRSEKGAIILDSGVQIDISAEPISKVVDKTGAGDAFAAGFLFGLTRDKDFKTCGRLGAIAAAEVISHYGPRPEHSLLEVAKAKGIKL